MSRVKYNELSCYHFSGIYHHFGLQVPIIRMGITSTTKENERYRVCLCFLRNS